MPIVNALVPAVLWLWLFFHLHYEWALNPQYAYGWAVPFLAPFMFYLRWPAPAARHRVGSPWTSIVAWALLFLLLPLRLIEEANPDWRLLSWNLALVVVGYSFITLLRTGGVASARHFAFPVCFALVAVPWPVRIENAVIQRLTGAVTFAAVEIAGWIGIGAYQIGNIIELHNGFVGVDEACSGVKTLQASIMVALVLGELLQLTAARRIGLLLLGCGWVFLCNVARATVLVVVAAKQGPQALDRWHDPVGTAALILGMAGLMGCAWLLRGKDAEVLRQDRAAPDRGAAGNPTFGSTRGAWAAVAWIGLVFVGTEFWYRSHETGLAQVATWHARWPADNPTFRPMPIAETTRTILRYDEATSGAWEDPPAVRWWSFFGRWRPQRAALQLVRSHSPEICLPAAGRTFVREREPIVVPTEVLPLRFRVYEFEERDRPLFVFVCIQEDKSIASGSPAQRANEWSARGRLLATWNGQRNLGQRLLEIAVTGFDDFLRAREAFAATVAAVVEKAAD